MYRKRNGSIGFSFQRFMNNAYPNLAADPHRFDDIPNLGRDMLYAHQLNSSHHNAPYGLDERSLFAAGICSNESVSRKIFQKLVKIQVISGDTGEVDTRQINGKTFVHDVAMLSLARQRELVEMLFWWEEECVRVRKLMVDQDDLKQQIEQLEGDGIQEDEENSGGDDVERRQLVDRLKFEREKVRMRIRQKPSERREDVENGTDDLYDETSAMHDGNVQRARSLPNVLGDDGGQGHHLPAYRP